MRVLITDGSGFLDSHFCEKLLEMRNDILNVENYFTGRKNNIGHLIGNPTETGVLELDETIIELTGSSSSLEYKKLPSDDPRKHCSLYFLGERRI